MIKLAAPTARLLVKVGLVMGWGLGKSIGLLGRLVWTVGPYLPATSMNTIWRGLDRQGRSILDIGGAQGEAMRFLTKKREFKLRVNADILLLHLKESKAKGTHDDYVLCDARHLPFREQSCDIVLCLEVIEHVEKEKGRGLLSDIERIARRQVMLSTPVGEDVTTEPSMTKRWPWCHFSSWHPAELRQLGYKVRGEGFPCVRGRLLVASTNRALSLLGYLLYPIASPFVYFFPDKAGGMTCVKSLNEGVRTSRES